MLQRSLNPYRFLGKLYLVASNSYKKQNFLGQKWIPTFLSKVPPAKRRTTALHLLGISPHYFISQWGNKYSRSLSRREVLEAEFQRNVESRTRIVNTVLESFLKPDLTVLDFGCGPGWLAKQMSGKVKAVKGIDISCGVLACARELNGAPNIEYIVNESDKLASIPDASIDLVVTFAVLQHIPDGLFESFVSEFSRVLKPDGRAVCHVALKSPQSQATGNESLAGRMKSQVSLLMIYRDEDYVRNVAAKAGFSSAEISMASRWTDVNDEIAGQHIAVLSK